MKKVDRLGWAAGFVVSPFGYRIGIRVNNESALPSLVDAIVPPDWNLAEEPDADAIYSLKIGGERAQRGVKDFNLLYNGSNLAGRSHDLQELIDLLREGLHYTLGVNAENLTFLHGNALHHNGKLILLPGAPGTGRKQLVRALVEQGATVYSNGYIVIDESGTVCPYRLPGSDEWSRSDLHDSDSPNLVVVTEFSEKVRSFRPRKLSPAEATSHLFAQSLSARAKPGQNLALLAKVAMRSQVIKARRPEAVEVASVILDRASKIR